MNTEDRADLAASLAEKIADEVVAYHDHDQQQRRDNLVALLVLFAAEIRRSAIEP